MIRLKDGTEAQDPRLGRLVQFDERSRSYPIRALVGGKPLRSYTWRVGVWLDQGNTPSCVGHAWAHELCARPRVTIVDQPYAMRIYHEAQKIDEWPGEAYAGTSVLAGAKVCQGLGHFIEYRWAFGLSDVILALGYAGPLVLGINWYRYMSNPAPDGRIQPQGELDGGHAILAYRVNVRAKQVWVHNSWGRSWNLDGVGWVSFDDLETLLHQSGEAVVPVKRKRVVPVA